MAGAGGQTTLIIPSHDLVVVRLGHYRGDAAGAPGFHKVVTATFMCLCFHDHRIIARVARIERQRNPGPAVLQADMHRQRTIPDFTSFNPGLRPLS
jgi:hypothetical protein